MATGKIETTYIGVTKTVQEAISKGAFTVLVPNEVQMPAVRVGENVLFVASSAVNYKKFIEAFNQTGLPHDDYKLLQMVDPYMPQGFAYSYGFDSEGFWRIGTEAKQDVVKAPVQFSDDFILEWWENLPGNQKEQYAAKHKPTWMFSTVDISFPVIKKIFLAEGKPDPVLADYPELQAPAPFVLNQVLGRQIKIILPNGAEHAAQFALVELDAVLASHNERTFANTPGYPLTPAGANVNDRNYTGDPNAQAQVTEYARNLQPERLVVTGRTPSGTPIITKDFICISGNNRTMSMKLAVSDYPEKYAAYKSFLKEEIAAFGLTEKDVDSLKKPFLVRFDYEFGEYSTSTLAAYNQDTKKGKRPVDKAVELSTILREKARCGDFIPTIVGEYERLSDFYANAADQKRMVDTLLDCNILTQQELPNYYTAQFGFTANGKILLEAVLSGIVLERDAILAGETEGVRSFRQHVVTSLPVLMANKELGADSLLPDVSEAIVLQQRVVGSGLKFHDFIAQGSIFGDEKRWSERALYLNRLLEKGQRAFKAGISKYNATLEDAGKSAGLFGDKPDGREAFSRFVVDALEESDRRAIRLYLGQGRKPASRLLELQARVLELRKKLAA